MYFLRQGNVQVLSADETKTFATLKAGSFFGEIALMEECRRTANVKTITDAQLCVLHKDDFHAILKEYPTMVDVFQRAVKEYRDVDKRRKEEREAEERKKKLEEQQKKEKEIELKKSISRSSRLDLRGTLGTLGKAPGKSFFHGSNLLLNGNKFGFASRSKGNVSDDDREKEKGK
jgi:CRP-like cAMP-binding protein